MTDLHRSLLENLPAAADRIPIRPGSVDAVVARCERRRRRQRVATSLGLVIALLGAVVSTQLKGGGDKGVEVSSAADAVRRGETGIDWRQEVTPDALAFVTARTGTGTLYAISTAAGAADPEAVSGPPRVLYRSDDGVQWSEASQLDARGLYLSDLAARGERLYAVGTAPANAVSAGRRVSNLVVSWSDDGARNWETTNLPLDVAGIAAKTIDSGPVVTRIASGPDGVLAVTIVSGRPDVPKLLPEGVSAANGWVVTTEGVDLVKAGPDCPEGLSPQPPGADDDEDRAIRRTGRAAITELWPTTCFAADGRSTTVTPQQLRGVERSFTWEQLGITGDVLRAVRRSPLAFFSADGKNFERVDLPVEQASALEVSATSRGYTVVAAADSSADKAGRVVALRSQDGRNWRAIGSSTAAGWTTTLGEHDGEIVMVGNGATGPSVSRLGEGGWSTAGLATALDPQAIENSTVNVQAAAVGPLGILAVAVISPDPIAEAGGVKFSSGDYTLHLLNDQWAAVVTDGAGREVGRVESLRAADDSSGLRFDHMTQTVSVFSKESGEEVARFDGTELMRKLEQSRPPEPVRGNHHLLFSRDGRTWSSQSLSELIKGPIGHVSNALVTDRNAIVTVAPSVGPNEKSGPATVLIGTL